MKTLSKGERSQEFIDRGVDFETRTLSLVGAIDREKFTQLKSNLRILKETNEPIILQLYSEGGDYFAGMAIFDELKSSDNSIIIEATGEIYSAAVAVLQAGDERILTPNTRFMIHNVWTASEEHVTLADLRRLTKEVHYLSKRYYNILSHKSGLSIATIRKLCEKETYFDAEQAVKFGFADKIKGHYDRS